MFDPPHVNKAKTPLIELCEFLNFEFIIFLLLSQFLNQFLDVDYFSPNVEI